MRQDKEVNVNWLRINVPQVVTIVLCTASIIWYVAGLSERITSIETTRETRSAVIDKSFDTVQKQLDGLNNIPLRMDLAEKNISQTNARFDQFLNTFGLKIDAMGDKVNSLGTKVEVLSNKIEQALPEKKAVFR